MDPELKNLRRRIIVAVASDDRLMETLILKGGNALQVVYEIGSRSSVDIDYSLEEDFADRDEISRSLEDALTRSFKEIDVVVFDFSFEARPRTEVHPRFGGYQAEFKLIERGLLDSFDGEIDDARRQALPVDDRHRRKFKIQISKYEYTAGSDEIDVDDYVVRVYTPTMIAAEKLRALCQQHPDYPKRGYPTPRARDLYDIHAIVVSVDIDLTEPDNVRLIRAMFEAKEVEPRLLLRLDGQREFHREEWDSVQASVAGELESFDYYFDFVLSLAAEVEAAWDV